MPTFILVVVTGLEKGRFAISRWVMNCIFSWLSVSSAVRLLGKQQRLPKVYVLCQEIVCQPPISLKQIKQMSAGQQNLLPFNQPCLTPDSPKLDTWSVALNIRYWGTEAAINGGMRRTGQLHLFDALSPTISCEHRNVFWKDTTQITWCT